MIRGIVDLYQREKGKKDEKSWNDICCFCKQKYDCDYFRRER